MVINNRRMMRLTFALILLGMLFIPGLLPSLSAQTPGYFIDQDSETPRFIQRLSWRGGEYSLRYEIVIQKLEQETYTDFIREFTTEHFILVSLTPGEYRFRIIPYDILDRPSEGSGWGSIEIRRAVKPEIAEVLQEPVISDEKSFTITFESISIVPEADMFLLEQESAPNDYSSRIDPDEVIFDEETNHISLVFGREHIPSGEYEIVIVNPGGLEARIGGIVIDAPEPEPEPEIHVIVEAEPDLDFDLPELETEPGKPRIPPIWNIGAAWMPAGPVYGNLFGNSISLAGGLVNFSVVFPAPGIYFGFEATVSAYSFNIESIDGDDGFGNYDNYSINSMAAAGLNLLLHKQLPNQITAVKLRFGVSYVFPQNNSDVASQELNIEIGSSFYWQIIGGIYMEAGVGYTHFFNLEYENILSGCLHPVIAFGWKF
jgi:hypothetical protein